MGLFDNQQPFGRPAVAPAAPAVPAPAPSMFDMIGESEGGKTANYIGPGIYLLQINVLKSALDRDKVPMFIAEFDILESTLPTPVHELSPGMPTCWLVKFHPGDKGKLAAQNVVDFLAGVMGSTPAEVDAAASAFACSDANPCHGMLVRCQAFNKPTLKGKDFTRCKWTHVPPDAQARAAELRAAAGFPPF